MPSRLFILGLNILMLFTSYKLGHYASRVLIYPLKSCREGELATVCRLVCILLTRLLVYSLKKGVTALDPELFMTSRGSDVILCNQHKQQQTTTGS